MANKNTDSSEPGIKIIARNKKARHDYSIEDTFEAGIVLIGTEVKSLRAGHVQLGDAYAQVKNGELWLENSHIDEYECGNRWNHQPRRRRKLLMHKREIHRLETKLKEKGLTLVVLNMYFLKGRAKVELGLGKGRKKYDHRENLKEREQRREIDNYMKRQRNRSE